MAALKAEIPFIATHPGVLIEDELDVRPELKQKDLALELGVKASFLNEIIKGKRPITADIAILLEKVFEISADYWMRFQSQYEIDKARIKEKNINRLQNIEWWSVIKSLVPVKNFKKHGFFNANLEKDIETIKSMYSVETVDELKAIIANGKFISKDCWQDVLNNYLPLNDDKIIAIGNKYGLNTAIILSRIAYEMNYPVLRVKAEMKESIL